MSDLKRCDSVDERVTAIFEHLELESKYLDSVIESGKEIQEILRIQRSAPIVSVDSDEYSEQLKRNQQTTQQLTELREQITRMFAPVLDARKKLPELLRTFVNENEELPTLSSLFFLIDEPERSRLKKLRTEIKKKLDQVYSITMGNQTVLIFTLNYYDQLLNGNQPKSDCYNASGLTAAQSFYKSTFVTTNC